MKRTATLIGPGVVVAAAAIGTGLGYTGLPWWVVAGGAAWLAALTMAVQGLFDEDPSVSIRQHRLVIALLIVPLLAAPAYHYAFDRSAEPTALRAYRYIVDADGPTAQSQFNGQAAWRYPAPDLDNSSLSPVLAGTPVDIVCVRYVDEITWGKLVTGRDWMPLVDLKPELSDQPTPPTCT